MKKFLFIFVALVLLIGCASSETPSTSDKKVPELQKEGEFAEGSSEDIKQDKATMEKTKEPITEQPVMKADFKNYKGQLLAGSISPLLDFVQADYEAALKTDQLIVLYFYATWCPLCIRETANALYPVFNELNNEQVIGFRINYKDDDTDDDEVALARQFGVPYQHTKVFVRSGQQILKSPESWDQERYLTEINKAL